jgi:uncharacterized protein YciI
MRTLRVIRCPLLAALTALFIATNALAQPLQPPDSPLPQPYGKVIGRVIDPSGKPFPYIAVALVARPAGNVAYQGHADHQGSFAFHDVVPGIYLLRTFGPGDIEVCNDCVDFTLAPGQTVERTLVADPAAKPGDEVRLRPDASTSELAAPLETYVVIYSPGGAWDSAAGESQLAGHLQYMDGVAANGQILMGGPFTDTAGGMVIMTAADLADATAIAEADPAVQDDIIDFEVHAWTVVYDRDSQPTAAQ